MKKIVFVFVLFSSVLAMAQKNIYESIRFDEYTEDHEILAIVPFIAHLELKKAVDNDELNVLAEKEGYAVQNALETYFSEYAETMRQKGIDRFGDKFSATRRILEEKT